MSTTVSRLLLNLGVFRADSVRTALGSYALNYTTQDGTITNSSYRLSPGQIVTFVPPTGSTSVLVITTTQRLRLDATFAEVEREIDGVLTVERYETTSSLYVTRSLVLDDTVSSLVIENLSSDTIATVNLFQG